MLKNTASQSVTLYAVDASTGLPKTGDAANMVFYVSKDDGSVTAIASNSGVPTEIDSTNAKGAYKIALSQAETNADKGLFSGKSSTSNVVVVPAVIYTDPPLYTAFVTPTGAAVNATQFAGQTITAAAGVTLPSSVASPTNITAGTITTVTNLTNAPTAGDLTATMKTSVTTAATAATPTAAAVTGAVGSVTGNVGGNVTGSVGSVAGAVGSVTGNVGGNVTGSVGSVVGAVGSVTGNVSGSVGSIATGGIAAASFAAGAIDATAIAANAIGASELAADAIGSSQLATTAVNEIRDAIFANAFAAAYGSFTFAQLTELIAAALLAKCSGMGTGTGTFRNLNDSADAIVASIDASGNRTAVTLTP